MAFQYTVLTKTDISRIYSDKKYDISWGKHLDYISKHHKFPEGWSFDAKKNEYLFRLPSIVRSACNEYHFYSRGIMYDIVSPIFSNKVSFRCFPESSEDDRKEIESKVSDAMAVSKDHHTWWDNELNMDSFSDEELEKRRPEFIEDNWDCDI